MIHRDVKPSNILVAEDDFAYLIDFGIARAAGVTGLTSTGATIGTWAYMAPERFQSGIADAHADIYALACVLYQALTGKLPFPGQTLEQIALAHIVTPPPQPSALKDEVPAAMDEVIATGMAKESDQRYATAKDLAVAAHAALARPTGRPGPPPPSPTGAEELPLHGGPEVPTDFTADARTQAGPTVSASHAPTQAPVSARTPPRSATTDINSTSDAVGERKMVTLGDLNEVHRRAVSVACGPRCSGWHSAIVLRRGHRTSGPSLAAASPYSYPDHRLAWKPGAREVPAGASLRTAELVWEPDTRRPVPDPEIDSDERETRPY